MAAAKFIVPPSLTTCLKRLGFVIRMGSNEVFTSSIKWLPTRTTHSFRNMLLKTVKLPFRELVLSASTRRKPKWFSCYAPVYAISQIYSARDYTNIRHCSSITESGKLWLWRRLSSYSPGSQQWVLLVSRLISADRSQTIDQGVDF